VYLRSFATSSSSSTLGMYSSPPRPGRLGRLPTQRNSLPLGLSTGTKRSQTCGVPPFNASPSWRALNSLPIVSSDAVTAFANYIHVNVLHNLKIGMQFLRMRSAILRLYASSVGKELSALTHKHGPALTHERGPYD